MTPRSRHVPTISSASESRAAIGLSVETPLTPASAQAMTASLNHFVGVMMAAMSGTTSSSREETSL